MIRQYSPAEDESDFAELKAAYLELANAPDALRYLSLTLKPFDEQTIVNWLRSHRENGVDYHVACEPDGQIVGIAALKADPVYGFELLGLMVRSDRRRRGIGRSLVEHAVGVAQQAGFRVVDVSVFADNKQMLRLLIGLDFVPVRLTPRGRADGVDIVHLKKYLAAA